MAALAACSNVWCKVSGLVTEAAWQGWSVEQLQPAVQHVRTVFGEDRLMFGSDWPVCLLAADYRTVKITAEACLAPMSSAVRARIFGANAIQAYALSLENDRC